MKKKFLSLMMAAAVVATTSVSAFADTVSAVGGKINGTDDKEYTTEVQIKGDVEDQGGAVLPGTLNVTVPSAATFRVNKENKLEGTNINVVNNGEQDIDIFAYKFSDPTENSGITVLGKNAISSENRTKVTLKLVGNLKTAYLSSNAGSSNGIYSDENVQTGSGEIKIANVPQGGTRELRLEGEAGSQGDAVTAPVKDTFTLVLKIKKGTK